MMRIYFLSLALLGLVLSGCAHEARQIVAEPLDRHDREQDILSCQQYAQKYGVINMEPVMAGSDETSFPDTKYKIQLYESCMLRKGYRF